MAFRWTQDLAVEELKTLVASIPHLSSGRRMSADHTAWVMRTLTFLEQVFGQNSRYYLSFAALTWNEESQFIIGGPGDPEGSWNPQVAIERRHHQAFLRHLEASKGVLEAALVDISRRGISEVYEGKDTPAESSAIVKIITLAERKLRKAIREKPEREKQVQDGFETLLVGADIAHEHF